MRQIIFDTETTGMNQRSANKAEGHRIIELGCVELINRQATGNTLHLYFNPEQTVDAEAVAVHGLDNERLKNEPTFQEKIDEIEQWLEGADELIAHNASFDVQFLNRELQLAGRNYRIQDKFKIIDTLKLAQAQNPRGRNSLDALCKRYNIDNSGREKHGALLDSELLLEVYLKLTGGQHSLFEAQNKTTQNKTTTHIQKNASTWLSIEIEQKTQEAHQAYLEKIRN